MVQESILTTGLLATGQESVTRAVQFFTFQPIPSDIHLLDARRIRLDDQSFVQHGKVVTERTQRKTQQ